MSKTPTVHLICNAHLDPVWQWHWEEGMTEALATFEVAADLLDEHPEFVFNHNEALLYEWVRTYRPDLFDRIRRRVAEGRWVIGGGWYLQPDCNLPCGESFVRHALLGRRFFRQAFGVMPRVAYNFDSFGHHGNMPQILRGSGYELYVHFRPTPAEKPIADDLYCWRGIDGSEIAALRPPCGWYHTADTARLKEKMTAMLKLARETGREVTLFWGAGDHGGGAARADLEAIRTVAEANPELQHSSLEAYWRAARRRAPSAAVITGELQKCFTGCYTSVIGVKQANRRGEGLVLAAERAAAIAWWVLGEPYPREKLADAWRKVLFNQFHDILPGSSVREGFRDAAEIHGHAFTQAREVLVTAHLRLLQRCARRQPMPLCVFNHQAARRRKLVELEFLGQATPQLMEGKTFRITDAKGRTVVSQWLEPTPRLENIVWRKRVAIEADLPALGTAEYRIHVEQGKPRPGKRTVRVRRLKNRLQFSTAHYTVSLNTRTGCLDALRERRSGKAFVAGPAGALLVREDTPHSWGPDEDPYGKVVGRFRCPNRKELSEIVGGHGLAVSGPVRIIEEGPLLTRVEVIQTYARSVARLRYTLAANHPEIALEILLNWTERCRALQLSLPTTMRADRYCAEIPYGAIEREVSGDEEPCGRWSLLLSPDRRLALGLVNDGPGGVEVKAGVLRQTLVRSPLFCTMAPAVAPDRLGEHMDMGEHIFRFFLRFGEADAVRADLPALADELSMPATVHVHLPLGPSRREGIASGHDVVKVNGKGMHLGALKQSEDGRALIVRVVETRGQRATARIRILGVAETPTLRLRPFEIKTLRFERRGGGVVCRETDLLERPIAR